MAERIADQAMERGQRQFVFLITGGIAALVNLATRIAFNLVMPFEIAIIVAYLCGMTTAYILARRFVFERSGRSLHTNMFASPW